MKEKKNFFKLNKFLDLLKVKNVNNMKIKYNIKEVINYCLKILIKDNIFEKIDKKIYRAYLKDLDDIGYDFSIFCNNKRNILDKLNYKKINSEFKLYIP